MYMIKVGDISYPIRLVELVKEWLTSLPDSIGEYWFFRDGGICLNLQVVFDEFNNHCCAELLKELDILNVMDWCEENEGFIGTLLEDIFEIMGLCPYYPIPFGESDYELRYKNYYGTLDKWQGEHLEQRLLLIDMCCNLLSNLLEE